MILDSYKIKSPNAVICRLSSVKATLIHISYFQAERSSKLFENLHSFRDEHFQNLSNYFQKNQSSAMDPNFQPRLPTWRGQTAYDNTDHGNFTRPVL